MNTATPTLHIPALLAFALAASSSASAQASDVTLTAPDVIRPLHGSMRVSVDGPGSMEIDEPPRIFVDGVDRSSQADVELVDETGFDHDGDGESDSLRLTYDVGVEGLDLAVGQVLEFDVTASTATGYVHRRSATPVESHIALNVPGYVVLDADDTTALHVEWLEMRDFASALVVRIAGYDVTNLVSISAPDLIDEEVVGAFVMSRTEVYELDFSALAGYGLEGLPLTIEAWGGEFNGGLTMDETTSTITTTEELTDCHKNALKDFCTALKLTKDAATGAVCSGATAAEQKAAAKALNTALALCIPPFPKNQQKYTCGQGAGAITIEISVGGTSQEANASGSAADNADAVIAVGGDAASPGSGEGGDAKATNANPGGAAIAIGGDGGSGTTSGGNGGNGHAEATNGPNGTPPGCASGVGGNGGSATPKQKKGGNGGSGYAHTSPKGKPSKTQRGTNGSAGTPPGGSNPGTGTYGGGGWMQVTGTNNPSAGNFPGGNNP